MYNTQFGLFTYRDVPDLAYPEDIILYEKNNFHLSLVKFY